MYRRRKRSSLRICVGEMVLLRFKRKRLLCSSSISNSLCQHSEEKRIEAQRDQRNSKIVIKTIQRRMESRFYLWSLFIFHLQTVQTCWGPCRPAPCPAIQSTGQATHKIIPFGYKAFHPALTDFQQSQKQASPATGGLLLPTRGQPYPSTRSCGIVITKYVTVSERTYAKPLYKWTLTLKTPEYISFQCPSWPSAIHEVS